ncbi:MAG: TetR family transcriptional regulator [Tissierellia bacterium]|nr:TetR family transcriptional regulator [Tissierellia bacterium]
MSNNLTKDLIRRVFIEMLNEKPLKDITIKDIVTKCDINRNTFYYHYADIYDLLSEIFQNELEIVVEEYNNTMSWEEAFLFAAKFSLENKKAIYHIYNSMQREELENYVYNVAGYVMSRYIERENEEINALEKDVKLITRFYQSALTGLVLQWISTRMQENPEEIINRIGELFNGHIQESLERSAKSDKFR